MFRGLSLLLSVFALSSHVMADEVVLVEVLLPSGNPARNDLQQVLSTTTLNGIELQVGATPDGDDFSRGLWSSNVVRKRDGKADIILNIGVTRTGSLSGFSAYDSKSGELLADQTVTDDKTSGLPEMLRALLPEVIKKRSAPRDQCRRVTISKVATNGLAVGGQQMVASFTESLERRLCDSSGIVLLPTTSRFWNTAARPSAVPERPLVESIEITVTWKPESLRYAVSTAFVQAEESRKIELESRALDSVLVEKMAAMICERLDVASVADTGGSESKRHARMAKSLWESARKADAIEAAELALVADPNNDEVLEWLGDHLLNEAQRAIGGRSPEWSGEQAEVLAVLGIQATCASVRVVDAEPDKGLARFIGGVKMSRRLSSMASLLRTLKSRVVESDFESLLAQVRSFMNHPADVARQLVTRKLKASGDTAGDRDLKNSLGLYSRVISSQTFHFSSVTSADTRLRDDLVLLTVRWLEDMETVPIQFRPWTSYASLLRSVTMGYSGDQAFQPVLEYLERHPEPFLKLLAKRGRLANRWRQEKTDEVTKAKEFKEVCDTVFAMLEDDDRPQIAKAALYFLDQSFNTF